MEGKGAHAVHGSGGPGFPGPVHRGDGLVAQFAERVVGPPQDLPGHRQGGPVVAEADLDVEVVPVVGGPLPNGRLGQRWSNSVPLGLRTNYADVIFEGRGVRLPTNDAFALLFLIQPL
jgi:hypothetical protein